MHHLKSILNEVKPADEDVGGLLPPINNINIFNRGLSKGTLYKDNIPIFAEVVRFGHTYPKLDSQTTPKKRADLKTRNL